MGDHVAHGPDSTFVEIDGHLVDTSKHNPDRFYSGRTGARVTDAEWDAESRIIAEHEAAAAARHEEGTHG